MYRTLDTLKVKPVKPRNHYTNFATLKAVERESPAKAQHKKINIVKKHLPERRYVTPTPGAQINFRKHGPAQSSTRRSVTPSYQYSEELRNQRINRNEAIQNRSFIKVKHMLQYNFDRK